MIAVKAVLETLAMMALQGSIVALVAVALVRGARLRPAWQAGVWLVVLAKFVLPWGPALPFSLADLFAMLRGTPAAAPIVVGAPAATGAAPAASVSGAWLVLAVVWAAGALVVLARAAIAHRAAHRTAARASAAPLHARALLAELAIRVGVRSPRLVVADAVGPHVLGLVRTIVVVPPALVEPGHDAMLRAALLHELAHVRRRDALGRLVQLIAHALFWWNPIVRIASRRLEQAREAACDAWALEAGEISRPAYARLLLEMAQLRTAAAPALAAPYGLGARVTSVLGDPVRARLGLAHKLALVAWIALVLGGARSAEARGDRNVCVYTHQLAEALRLAHPEADVDGDGVLSRDEACEYQAEVARRVVESEQVSTLDEATAELLAEPLCCNCDAGEGLSSPAISDTSCQ
ncbi:MAG TPA: M56 family metallopeptidase [Kofleriaceae bacterium]|nr:M56 family metallopeptidase [Kofleriaceae bacterium]